jgi:DnaK suppressor protein
MDKRSLERFQKSLEARRDDLRHRLKIANQEGRDPSLSESKDEGDLANASLTSEITDAQQTQAQNLLRAVDSALGRIQNGTFGECIRCDQEIGASRLAAIPWTPYCITCQELIAGH